MSSVGPGAGGAARTVAEGDDGGRGGGGFVGRRTDRPLLGRRRPRVVASRLEPWDLAGAGVAGWNAGLRPRGDGLGRGTDGSLRDLRRRPALGSLLGRLRVARLGNASGRIDRAA